MALLYGAVGACIVGIPLAVLLILQICSSTALKRQVIDYKQLEKQGLYLHVWTLKQDIPAREKVTRADLLQKKIWVPETEYPTYVTQIGQITGKKAKTALKKGAVIRADMLYSKKKAG